jgi:peptidoglycan/xylan/chitin deacetylase (PgdA/CDA1 family)
VEARRLKRPGLPRLRLGGVRVLLYHAVGEHTGGDPRYAISRAELAGHLEQIRCGGHRVVPLADIGSDSEQDGAPAVALTFDDGRLSDYTEVFPLLREHGVVAEFFVNPGRIGRPRFLTWDQAREMARAGMRFQSHGYDHVYLTPLSAAALERQVGDSKRRLEDELGVRVEFLAAPYGDLNRRVCEAAMAAGYRAVCTSWDWPARAGRRTVSRIAVYARTTREEVSRLLQGDPVPYVLRMGRSALLHPVKRVVLRLWPRKLIDRATESAA